MLKAGITGGIGAGKSIVCQVFEALGIPVFYADAAGKYLMENDPAVMGAIQSLFGTDIYQNGILDRQKIAAIVFRYPGELQKLNEIIHPAVIRYGREWMEQQHAPYVMKEAALFFETGSDKDMDLMIGVFAPRKTRILRAMERDHSTQESVLARMAQQMDEQEKMSRCSFIIHNDGLQAILPQVLQVHEALLKRAESGS